MKYVIRERITLHVFILLELVTMSVTVDRKRVAIVGAGASGMAAATRLYENGVKDIIVLEAENRIGGRVNTVDIENGFIEMGAEWIHGEKDNVVYALASARKLACDPLSTLSPPPRQRIFVRSSGELVEPKLVDKIFKMFMELLEHPRNGSKLFPNCGEFYRHILKSEFEKRENANISEEMRAEITEYCHKCLNSFDASDTWFNTSITSFDEFELCEGNHRIMWNKTGYRALFEVLMEKSQELSNGSFKSDIVALNHEVSRISINEQGPGIIIECSNGRKINVDYVIVTISVGALREAYKTLFENMPVPELNIRSINNIELGTVDKIYLEFSKPWWPKEFSGFELLWTKNDVAEYAQKDLGWVTDIFAVVETDFAPNALCAWISGVSARTMESLREEFVRDTIVEMLRKIFQSNGKWEVPDPVRVIRSTWYSNKHFRGSWSYRSLRTEKANVSASTLSTPVYNTKGMPVLLFAGEATSPHHYASVHGAVESGWREADRLLSFVKKS